jgi:hypothetical protein
VGGKLHLMLRMCSKPIAHKYHEGKMKRTLERELKVTEIAEREADGSTEAKQLAVHCRSVVLHQRKKCSAAQSALCGVFCFVCQSQFSTKEYRSDMQPFLWEGNDVLHDLFGNCCSLVRCLA